MSDFDQLIQKSTKTFLTEQEEQLRWKDLDCILTRKGPFAKQEFDPTGQTFGITPKEFLHQYCKILIIGAGGLGCDLLKNLALSGFKDIHIIDLDTIDLSNLNRQFLFREKDIGFSKAQTAANFINKRCPGVKVTAHHGNIEDKNDDFYRQFQIVIAGLDSIKARQWLNKKLCDLVEYTDDEQTQINPSTCRPLIDGGTEGFKGQARVIWPRKNSCYECTMDLFPPQTTYPLCTIASTPRLPEHCIEFASVMEWEKQKDKKGIPDKTPIDGDNPDHIKWLFEVAEARAKKFGIRGVTYRLTQGVIKNIIPAIASTNAIVASACTNEALKLATLMYSEMKDYMFYNGNEGIFTYTYENERKPSCPVCRSLRAMKFVCDKSETLGDLVHRIPNSKLFKLHLGDAVLGDSYSVMGEKNFYNSDVPNLEKVLRPNLSKKLEELGIEHGDELTILSKGWSQSFPIIVVYE
jgi:ubiquitin-activating enzyme E1 C